MAKLILIVICSLLLLTINYSPVLAIVDPLSVANNRYGIHILETNEVPDAASLVNGNGGEWGYITLVIRQDDLDVGKWQDMFDEMRRRKLIPIVRLATYAKDNVWSKPESTDATIWAQFLGKLNWVVKNRYVILFNEPNHAKEWSNQVKPNEYAAIVRVFHDALKAQSEDFFILPAGFDSSATNGSGTMSASNYLKQMHKADPGIFTLFDGWTSHAYPNPGFASSPMSAAGQKSIKSYTSELSTAVSLGLKANPPIFITETGWVHKEGLSDLDSAPDSDQTSEFFKYSYEHIWTDSRIVAITPFVFRYTQPPFDHFSWVAQDGSYYPQYDVVRQLQKIKGAPIQNNNFVIEQNSIPNQLIKSSIYDLDISIQNNGQTIWYDRDITGRVELTPKTGGEDIVPLPYLEPGNAGKLRVHIITPNSDKVDFNIMLFYKGKSFGEKITKTIHLIPPTTLRIHASLFGKLVPLTSKQFTLLIYDDVNVKKQINNVTFIEGEAQVTDIHDIIPEHTYRLVLLTSYYLPKQTFAFFGRQETLIIFERMVPVDFNQDGKFSLVDVWAGVTHPLITARVLWPFK